MECDGLGDCLFASNHVPAKSVDDYETPPNERLRLDRYKADNTQRKKKTEAYMTNPTIVRL